MTFVYERARFSECRDEIEDMLRRQWPQTGDRQLACEPDWKIYERMDASGYGYLWVARRDDQIVGYVAGVMHPHINSRNVKVASIPTYFVEDGPVRAFIVKSLIEQAAKYFIDQGARQVMVDTEYRNSAGKLLELIGFEPNKIGYILRVGGLNA